MKKLDDMTVSELREHCDGLPNLNQQYKGARATLILHSREGNLLHCHGFDFDGTGSLSRNMVQLVANLTSVIERLRDELDKYPKTAGGAPVKTEPTAESCGECRFWIESDIKKLGPCRLHPTEVVKYSHEWCAEYKAVEVKE